MSFKKRGVKAVEVESWVPDSLPGLTRELKLQQHLVAPVIPYGVKADWEDSLAAYRGPDIEVRVHAGLYGIGYEPCLGLAVEVRTDEMDYTTCLTVDSGWKMEHLGYTGDRMIILRFRQARSRPKPAAQLTQGQEE